MESQRSRDPTETEDDETMINFNERMPKII
jgi:hypothetical protein